MGVFQRYIKKDKDGNPVLGKNGMPRKEGPWFIQYPHSRNPKTRKIKYRTEKASFGKKKAEKMFRAKLDAFQETDMLGVQINQEITFSELMDWALEQEVMKNKASANDDRIRAEHLKVEFGQIRALQITPLMVDNFRIKMVKTICERTDRPYSGTTVNKLVSLARRAYNLGIAGRFINTNPFAKGGVYYEEPQGQYIPDRDFWKVIGKLPVHLKGIAIVGYFTGMRQGEIRNLGWCRVNMALGYIDLSQKDTKTREPRRIYFGTQKILKRVFQQAGQRRMPGQKVVFLKPDGTALHKKNIAERWKKACQAAKVGPYRFHDLRHTFTTNMIKAGVPQTTIMRITGHKTLAMFLRYSHLDEGQSEEAMEKLGRFMSKRTEPRSQPAG